MFLVIGTIRETQENTSLSFGPTYVDISRQQAAENVAKVTFVIPFRSLSICEVEYHLIYVEDFWDLP